MKGCRFSCVAPLGARARWGSVLSLLVATSGLLAPLVASARILDLGWTPGGVLSQAAAVSGDGQIVMGLVLTDADQHQLFRWTEQGGMTLFASAAEPMEVTALSHNGAVLVGATTEAGNLRAFRWEAGSGMQSLGTLGGDTSRAYGISADGSVVVGGADNASAVSRAFRWTSAQGMQELGGLTATGLSTAYGVSAAGDVVVGSSMGGAGLRAVRWQNGAILDLGTLAGNNRSEAYGISADGQVVVGSSDADAFRWTAATGMQNLGSLGGLLSSAAATNADGSVVVGSSSLADGSLRAFRWGLDTGMVDLGVLNGGSYSTAYGVSGDGRVIVGEGDNPQGVRAVVWSLRPAADNRPQDLADLQDSVITGADTLTRLQDALARRTGDLAMQSCLPGAAQRYCLAVRADAEFAGAGDDSRQYQGLLLSGRRLNEQFSMGLNAQVARLSLNAQGARQRPGYGAGIWLAYQQQATSGLGWNAMAGVAASHAKARFERGEQLADVQAASTRLRQTAYAQRLAVGYGIAVGHSLLTPELALSHGSTEHAGFTERNVALPLNVERARADTTYATLALRSATPLTAKTTLQLTLAADALLQDDQPAFSGRSDIPGLNRFALDSRLDKRDLVPRAAAQLSYAINPQTTVAAGVQVAASTYQQAQPVLGVGAQFSYRF